MSQRTSAAVSSQHQDGDQGQGQVFPPDNHLMPASLRRVPSWFQLGPFQYNLRFLIGFLPGALLVGAVTRRLMVGAAVLGAVVALLLRSTEQKYLAMIVSIMHIFGLAVLNVYCMAPLIWQSVLNIPLFLLFHVFIAISGIWWWLQDEHFRKQDPRFLILVEKMLFALYPGLSVTMVTWVCGMLFGRTVLPYAVGLAGLVALSVFVTPLQSSFAKPNTPTNTGMIQHWSVALVYILLEICLPALLHLALFHTPSLHSWMVVGLLILTPIFLMSLLESQGLFTWTGLGPKLVHYIRWLSGAAVMLLFSAVVFLSRPSSLLPFLIIPLTFTYLGLISAVEHSSSSSSSSSSPSSSSITLAACAALLSSAAYFFLPWSITHYFTFLALPLSVVQLLLWCITIATVAIITFYKKLPSSLWLPFNFLFVSCEYIMSWDSVYPSYLGLTTAMAAALLFWRMHAVGHLPQNTCLLISSLHLTKISLLLPTSTPHTHTLPTMAAIFLLSYLILRLFVFQSHPFSVSLGQLLVFCGLLCAGLLLGLDSILTPLWLSFTHRLPSTASLIGTIIATTGLFMNHGLSFMRSTDAGKLSILPPGLVLMSVLLFLLQPEFDPAQLGEAVVIVMAGSEGTGSLSPMPVEILMGAWLQLLSWAVLLSAGMLVLAVAGSWAPRLTTPAATLLGAALGAQATVMLLHSPPPSLSGLLYTLVGAVTGALLGRAYATPTKAVGQGLTDTILYVVMLLAVAGAFSWEYMTTPQMYMPRMKRFQFLSLPSTRLGMAVAALIALAFRAKMYHCFEKPYLPLPANISCLLFFLLSLLNPLHIEYEVSVVLSSLIFLLAQPDGRLFPQSSSLFLAPSLLASVLILYLLAASRILPKAFGAFMKGASLFAATRSLELVCLVGSLPGQATFLYYLWTGRQLKLSVFYLVLYIVPNAFLPQLASSSSSTILGIVGVLSFCLIMLGDYTSLKLS